MSKSPLFEIVHHDMPESVIGTDLFIRDEIYATEFFRPCYDRRRILKIFFVAKIKLFDFFLQNNTEAPYCRGNIIEDAFSKY